MIVELSKAEIFEALETAEEVSTGTWRWGHTHTYVFERDGKHFQFTAQFHSEEGLMTETARAIEVRPVERIVKTWEAVPAEEGARTT